MARILNTEQAAAKLQVKPLTVRKYLRNGLIPGKRIGKQWRIVEEDLDAFVSSGGERNSVGRVSLLGICEDVAGFGSLEFAKGKQSEADIEGGKLGKTRGSGY